MVPNLRSNSLHLSVYRVVTLYLDIYSKLMAWKVRFYQTARGEYPVKKLLDSLDRPAFAKVSKIIFLLRDYGPILRQPYSKKVQKNLFELRVPGAVAIRIIYCCVGGEYYLLHAFKKKTQKIPRRELKIALDRMKELI